MKATRWNVVFLVLVFICILAVNIFLTQKHTPGQIIGSAYGLEVIEKPLSEDSPLRTNVKRKIKYIVIHETGNQSSSANASSHAHYLEEGGDGNKTAWHYTVDDSVSYHHIPDDEIAFHAGRGNRNGIGIELCVNAGSDFEKTFQNGAKLTAKLIDTYDLNINSVKQHGDFMNKNCPENIRNDKRWNEFILLVQKYLGEF